MQQDIAAPQPAGTRFARGGGEILKLRPHINTNDTTRQTPQEAAFTPLHLHTILRLSDAATGGELVDPPGECNIAPVSISFISAKISRS